jgi:Carboxypeptidase regulatory-like domain
MTRARVLGALFALLALVGCNDSALPPGGTYQALSGTVLDAVTHQPIAGAVVTVDTVLNTTTDAAGKFHFAQVPVGEVDYVVTTPKGSYRLHQGQAHLAPDKPLELSITLSR